MAEHLTKEQTRDRIAALLRERQSYVLYGTDAQVKDVDVELDRLGHKAKPPAKRATKMTGPKGTEL
jgi:hypothetical protein